MQLLVENKAVASEGVWMYRMHPSCITMVKVARLCFVKLHVLHRAKSAALDKLYLGT